MTPLPGILRNAAMAATLPYLDAVKCPENAITKDQTLLTNTGFGAET